MAWRVKLALAIGLLMAASHATAGATPASGSEGARWPLVMQSSVQVPHGIIAPPAAVEPEPAEAPTEVAPSLPPAPTPQMMTVPARPSGPIGTPSLADGPPVDTSQLLWIIIALLALVGLAMSRVGRPKSPVSETFEPEVLPQVVRSKVDAALDAALSAQSGPVRLATGSNAPSTLTSGFGVEPATTPKAPPVRFDLPLVVHDPRPRFGKR